MSVLFEYLSCMVNLDGATIALKTDPRLNDVTCAACCECRQTERKWKEGQISCSLSNDGQLDRLYSKRSLIHQSWGLIWGLWKKIPRLFCWKGWKDQSSHLSPIVWPFYCLDLPYSLEPVWASRYLLLTKLPPSLNLAALPLMLSNLAFSKRSWSQCPTNYKQRSSLRDVSHSFKMKQRDKPWSWWCEIRSIGVNCSHVCVENHKH